MSARASLALAAETERGVCVSELYVRLSENEFAERRKHKIYIVISPRARADTLYKISLHLLTALTALLSLAAHSSPA